LLAFLRGDLVERWHWLTNTQLLDAIAVGQITPGRFLPPQLLSATYWGRQRAAVATLGIFLQPLFLSRSAVP